VRGVERGMIDNNAKKDACASVGLEDFSGDIEGLRLYIYKISLEDEL
jgi:hypothetical protein